MSRKFTGGEKFAVSHQDHNRWQDAGAYVAARASGSGGSLEMPDEQTGVILVKNTLSRDLPRYSVLSLRGSVYNPLNTPQGLADFKNQIVLKGEMPDPDITGRFCVLQLDAPAGAVVPALVLGVTPVRLSITSVDDEFAEIETDSEVSDKTRYLKSGSTGSAQILFQPEVEGEQWGVVRLGNRTVGQQVYLAEFKAHASPDPSYTYPVPATGNQDVVFPAYLVDGPTFDDTDPFTKNAFPTASGLGSAVFVHSLRRTYVPPKVASGIYLPVYKINEKYWIDHQSVAPRVSFWATNTSSTLSSGSEDISTILGSVNYEWASKDYSPLQVSTAGVITAYYNLQVLVTVTATIEPVSHSGTDAIRARITHSGTSSEQPLLQELHFVFPLPGTSGSYAAGRTTVTAQGIVNFELNETLKFVLYNDGGGSFQLSHFNVQLSPTYGL